MLSILDFINNRKSSIRIAHRGGMALYPENTLEAFHFSVDKHNVEMLELDLQITKDDKVIVLHDDSIDRTTNGKGNVIDLSYEEISEFDAGYGFKDKNVPITSIRRAITNLESEGLLHKTDIQKPGVYGKLNYCWVYKEKVNNDESQLSFI